MSIDPCFGVCCGFDQILFFCEFPSYVWVLLISSAAFSSLLLVQKEGQTVRPKGPVSFHVCLKFFFDFS